MQRISNYLVGHYVFGALNVLEKNEVLAYLKSRSEGVSAEHMARELNLDQLILESLLDFLAVNTPEYFKKKGDTYTVSRAFFVNQIQNALFFALAYEPVLHDLDALLKKEKMYGTDVVRDGVYLGASSALNNMYVRTEALDLLDVMDIDTVIDLGCGSGDFLASIQERLPGVFAVGVECDRDVAHVARQKIESASRKGLVIEGDAARPTQWFSLVKDHPLKKTVIVGFTLWHEFLLHGEIELMGIIKEYARLFPGALLLIIEKNGYTLDDLSRLPDSHRELTSVYQLVHPLTEQGLPQPPTVWKKMFEKIGVELMVTSCASDMTIYTGILSLPHG